jgi:hypothetical protein
MSSHGEVICCPATVFLLAIGLKTNTRTFGSATSMDPRGYLTSLNTVTLKSDAEIGDIKSARMLFDSLVKSNPKHLTVSRFVLTCECSHYDGTPMVCQERRMCLSAREANTHTRCCTSRILRLVPEMGG